MSSNANFNPETYYLNLESGQSVIFPEGPTQQGYAGPDFSQKDINNILDQQGYRQNSDNTSSRFGIGLAAGVASSLALVGVTVATPPLRDMALGYAGVQRIASSPTPAASAEATPSITASASASSSESPTIAPSPGAALGTPEVTPTLSPQAACLNQLPLNVLVGQSIVLTTPAEVPAATAEALNQAYIGGIVITGGALTTEQVEDFTATQALTPRILVDNPEAPVNQPADTDSILAALKNGETTIPRLYPATTPQTIVNDVTTELKTAIQSGEIDRLDFVTSRETIFDEKEIGACTIKKTLQAAKATATPSTTSATPSASPTVAPSASPTPTTATP